MPRIHGGYFLKARQIKNSFIAHASPCTREIWDYCLREANHKDGVSHGHIIKRGQLFRSLKDIKNDLFWYVGYRKEYYHESQMKHCMNRLVKELMITTAKEPRGVLITVLNYDQYQNPKNYEGTSDDLLKEPLKGPSRNQQPPSINKNDKKEKNNKNDKEEVRGENFSPPAIEEVVNYCRERKNTVNPSKWYDHYTSNGWMVGRNKMKDWKAAIRTWENGGNYERSIRPNQGQSSQSALSTKVYHDTDGNVIER